LGDLLPAPLLAQQQILEYHSEDTPGDTRFVAVYPTKACGFSQVSRLSSLRLPSCVSPVGPWAFLILIRSVDGGSERLAVSALLSFESLYLLLQLLNHRLLMQDNHQLLWRQLLEAFRFQLSAGMHSF